MFQRFFSYAMALSQWENALTSPLRGGRNRWIRPLWWGHGGGRLFCGEAECTLLCCRGLASNGVRSCLDPCCACQKKFASMRRKLCFPNTFFFNDKHGHSANGSTNNTSIHHGLVVAVECPQGAFLTNVVLRRLGLEWGADLSRPVLRM